MANEDEEKLINDMAEAAWLKGIAKAVPETWLIAEAMLSVVKSNIGVVAMVCSGCNGFGEIHDGDNCPDCHGSGVVARKESHD